MFSRFAARLRSSPTSRLALRAPTTLAKQQQQQQLATRRMLSSASSSSSGAPQQTPQNLTNWQKFWAWTTKPQPEHERFSQAWYREMFFLCVIFGIVGSATMKFVRPTLKKIGFEGSLWEGPNSYRIASLTIVTPLYTVILLTLGTICGRHRKFSQVGMRMWGRMLPKSLIRKMVCEPARKKMIEAAAAK